ncbi:hypothetical protein Kpol_333p7 [Vanderwaltozyma polyspora DSM 70294]|uniref:GID complex catalytic subunit 2 n=1 Tax=Vanderwaltozyma polyspora (strain ATCC 22028 / DSM 70294 / BCRC 21397 / CBS 2163 / NBRC 10782 / NRRL Y-8283 / UCD 57-17) TaxID=436907 RepID=A7TSM4_VANPO|nr:uncharacterized protein Kpol_333p7 [Vanderwaltozyma polyspora DSM 70294]EDO14737.1 hypothetical protein Kpol_333p7 [Vanderwaltozyma polyspora DSM 70294]
MSELLNTLNNEYPKLFTDETLTASLSKKCLDDTQEFKTQLRKMKAHWNKYLQDLENNSDDKKLSKKRSLVIDKLSKVHQQWDSNIHKNVKLSSNQYSKFNRNIMKELRQFDLDEVYVNKISKDAKPYIDKAIGFHISRYGLSNISIKDTDEMVNYINEIYGVDTKIAGMYISMGQIIQDLKNYDTKSCIDWCQNGTDLHFELFVLNIMILVKRNDALEIYDYMKNGIPTTLFENKINKVMTKLSPLITKVYIKQRVENIEELIYEQSRKCISIFSKDYCQADKLPFDSSLFLIVLSGIISFQFFFKYKNIRSSLNVDWTTKDELPFDVKLPKLLSNFHPIFICPVLKEETTEDNPPYSLPCHHIISKKALDKLSKNGTTSFKCPYCPVNAMIAKTRKVNFIMI